MPVGPTPFPVTWARIFARVAFGLAISDYVLIAVTFGLERFAPRLLPNSERLTRVYIAFLLLVAASALILAIRGMRLSNKKEWPYVKAYALPAIALSLPLIGLSCCCSLALMPGFGLHLHH